MRRAPAQRLPQEAPQQWEEQSQSGEPTYALTFFVEGQSTLSGILTLKSVEEIAPNVKLHRYISSKLSEHLRHPTNAQIAEFRDSLLVQNPSLSKEDVYKISAQELVKGVVLSRLYEDIRETVLAMNVRSLSLDVIIA